MTQIQRNGNAKSAFSAWLRENKALESKATGLVFTDFDWIVRKRWIQATYGRDESIQNLMVIEEKRSGDSLGTYQQDSIGALNQLLLQSERRDRPFIYDIRLPGTGQRVTMRYYGYHLLQFSASGPYDSDWIKWDTKPVTKETLEAVLRFDICPFTLRQMPTEFP